MPLREEDISWPFPNGERWWVEGADHILTIDSVVCLVDLIKGFDERSTDDAGAPVAGVPVTAGGNAAGGNAGARSWTESILRTVLAPTSRQVTWMMPAPDIRRQASRL